MKRKYIIACLVAAILIPLFIWTLWGNTALEVNEVIIESGRIPDSFKGYRIAQVSDLHNAEIGENNEKLLNALAKAKPDIIVITGDLIDTWHTDIDVSLAFAEKAVEIAPVYYVTGNHEERIEIDLREFEEKLMNYGVRILHGESVMIEKGGESIQLVGLDDPNFYLRKNPYAEKDDVIRSEIERLKADGYYTVLLAHRPELFEVYVETGVDLAFSGHAHGGQFYLPVIGGIYAPGQGFFPEYDSGIYAEGITSMLVSRGIGNSLFPLRFNNRPEIIVTEFKCE